MKRAYFRTFVVFAVTAVSLCLLAGCRTNPKTKALAVQPVLRPTAREEVLETLPVPTAPAVTVPEETGVPVAQNVTMDHIPASPRASMEDALFIGDSRTVGLLDYARREGADYFADVGMTVYNVNDLTRPVPSVGRVTLKELLSSKHYGKIYVMLGINEAGYRVEQTAEYYDRLVERIRRAQPDAEIYLQANLHVSESRSRRDTMINNPVLDKINGHISEIAHKRQVFYLDANEIFDDSTGSLSSRITGDETHLYGKYYEVWADWIAWKTAVLREDSGL